MNADMARMNAIGTMRISTERRFVGYLRLSARHLRSSAFLVSALALSTTGAAQTLYKCTQRDGKVVYQQDKCAATHKESTIRAPDPVAAKTDDEVKSAGAKDAKSAQMQMNQIMQVIADASLCTNDVKGWDEKNGKALSAWKARNGQVVAKFDQDPEAQANAVARMSAERTRLTGGRLAERCEAVAASLGGPAPAK